MKLRTSLAAAGTAVVLGTTVVLGATGALALPAVASTHTATHTLKFISVTKNSVNSKKSGAQQDTDVNGAGKTIGFDMLYFAFVSSSTADGNIAVDTTGGFLYGKFTFSLKKQGPIDGKITGGTGSYAGATGTFKTKNLNAAGTRVAVAITYKG